MTIYTLEELARVADAASDASLRQRQTLGLLLPRIAGQLAPDGPGVGWHVAQLQQAIAEGRAQVYFDTYGRQAGAMFWKRLDEAGEAALLAGGDAAVLAHAPDGEAWMAHFSVQHIALSALLRHAAVGALADVEELAYARIRRGWRMAKRLRVPAHWRRAAPRAEAADDFLKRERHWHRDIADMLDHARRMGDCLILAGANPAYADLSPADVLAALETPLQRGQYLEQTAADGSVAAFMTYALLTDDGLARLRQQGASALCPACFSEGDVLAATCAGAVDDPPAQAALAQQVAALYPQLTRALDGTGVAALPVS
jgi:hypothetical protein